MSGLFSEPVPVPVVWSDLSAGAAFDTWTDLAGWVTRLVRRFRLRPREVPPCWFRHAAVVEELTALWGSWRVAYGDDQLATSAADWLRMFADTRLRLAEWMARAGCTATEHRDDPDVAWADDDPEFGHYIGADCAARSAPAFPSDEQGWGRALTGRREPIDGPEASVHDLANVVPNARRIHPVELAVVDALFDNTGALHRITEATTFQDGRIVSALQDNNHRVWFWNDEPITAILQRAERPSLTCYARVLDASDEEGWAAG